jgi:hypothetical protein
MYIHALHYIMALFHYVLFHCYLLSQKKLDFQNKDHSPHED